MSVINTVRVYYWESIVCILLLLFRHPGLVQLFTLKNNLFKELINKNQSGSSKKICFDPFSEQLG